MASVLFLHPSYPAQFRHIADFLAQQGHTVVFLTANVSQPWNIPGVIREHYTPQKVESVSPFANLDKCKGHANGAAKACLALRKKGFIPDAIYGASGWGCTWFLRDIFPDARILGYFEWYYHADSADSRFGRGEPSLESRVNMRLRNPVIVNDLLACDVCITPTKWQRAQFPEQFKPQMVAFHDGIDTDYFCPKKERLDIDNLPLTGEEEIVTWTTRGMEPYRGFPQFIEALPIILKERKDAHVVIAGEDRVCYGSPRDDGKSWKTFMLERVPLPAERVHFTGGLPYGKYLGLLRCSSAHVYLTRPFILSWSMLEAMSTGCLPVASRMEPVEEVITDGENGLLCDFTSSASIAEKTIIALEKQVEMAPLRENARQTVLDNYSLKDSLKKQEQYILG